jgi:signal transduction histidine kinase
VALGLPCAAWYVAGSRAARDEAARLEQAPLREAGLLAEQVADSVAARLEALRQSESRRSFLDYRPGPAALPPGSCESLVRSPLAEGPPDPLVWAHFQIDQVGQLVLPAFHGARGEGSRTAEQEREVEQAILEQLECAATDRLAAAERRSGEPQTLGAGPEWVVSVGPLSWHTLVLESGSALAAVRAVATPAAELSQGFVVRAADLETLLADTALPARVGPGRPDGAAEVRLPIEGAEWTVSVDAGAGIEAAHAAAARLRSGFRRDFALGLVGAALAGALVVGLVRRTEQFARQRAQFAASAAHELRTPLAGLRLYGEMLADGSGDPASAAQYARRIAGEAERLGRVVSNLLGFSRLERGELRLHCARGDLGQAVRESLEALRPTIELSGARIEARLAPTLPAVRFDRDAVRQILQNLLDNAEKYSRQSDDRTIDVELRPDGGGVELAVTDRGPGVEPALRHRLFQPFVRHPSPDAPDGLGLGLALVRALARAQHAEAAYAGTPGGGTRFSVVFPLACE